MCCPNPRDLGLEFVMTVTCLCWSLGWFFFGHLISMAMFSCRDGWSQCAFFEPFGIVFGFCAMIIYFFCLRQVANALYGRKLPIGEELTKEMKGSLGNFLEAGGVKINKKRK